MSLQKSSAAVGESRFARLDGHAGEIALDVRRELGGGRIAAFGLLAQRLHHDGVEIAAQSAPQFSGMHAALGAHGLWSKGSSRVAIGRYFFFRPVNDSARFFGIGFANQSLHFQERLARRTIRPMAGQQFEEQYAQGIDIGCGSNRVPADLLGAGIFRGHRTPVGSSDQRRLETFGIQQFGDAKVQQSGHTAFCDQDIARLEIAMDHADFHAHTAPRNRLGEKAADGRRWRAW